MGGRRRGTARSRADALRRVAEILLPGRLLDWFVLLLLAIGVALLVTPHSWSPPWFYPRLTGLGAIGYALTLVVLGLIFHERKGLPAERVARHRRARRQLQIVAAVTMLLGLSGTFGLYRLHDVGFDYDKALHFMVPALVTHSYARLLLRGDRRTARRATWLAVAIMGGLGLLWELTELASDHLFGTSAFGEQGASPFLDTFLDVSLDAAGIAFGVLTARRVK